MGTPARDRRAFQISRGRGQPLHAGGRPHVRPDGAPADCRENSFMQKFIRLLGAVALIGIGLWIWLTFFPSPEKAIRSRLNNLAKTISFEPNDGAIARGYSAQKAAGFFTLNGEVHVEVRGMEPLDFSGRD